MCIVGLNAALHTIEVFGVALQILAVIVLSSIVEKSVIYTVFVQQVYKQLFAGLLRHNCITGKVILRGYGSADLFLCTDTVVVVTTEIGRAIHRSTG